MKARIDFKKTLPLGAKALGELHRFVHDCGLEQSLLELIKLRASQINGCAHCMDLHARKLRAVGESEQRVYLLGAWRESPIYSPRERAALAWTEAVTLIPGNSVPDEVFAEALTQFSEVELAKLTLAVIAINGANRLNIAFRTVPEPAAPMGEAVVAS